MISVEFRSVGEGLCSWCGKTKDEVFDVALSDKSFIGLYCRVDLMKAVTMKCERRAKAAQPVGQANGSAQSLGQGGPGITTTEHAKK